MLLLTGATGLVGSALLPRLTASGRPVRCLVRDPRRLGAERVRVQIALGDLSDPASFRNALRGVDTVVHLAAAIRDQPGGSIEETNAVATWRMVQAAQRAGVERFVFFSAQSASAHNRTRFMRAKALAERAVAESRVPHTIFAPSIVYAPGDVFLTLLERMALLPVVPISGSGRALFQPIWAQDVADCVMAALERSDGRRALRAVGPRDAELRRDRRARPARGRAAAAAGARSARRGQPLAAHAGGAHALEGLRHVGRGRAHGGHHDRGPRDPRRRGARRDAQAHVFRPGHELGHD